MRNELFNRYKLYASLCQIPIQSVLNGLTSTLYSLDGERAKKLIEQFIHPPSNLNFALNGRGVYFVSNQCNLHCMYCKGLASGMDAPNLEEFEQVLQEWRSRRLKYLHLTGLEPTVCPYILDYLKIAQKYQFEVSMSTNGYADFDHYWELVRHGLKYLSISLDAHNEAIASQMGGREDIYARVSANIRRLMALKRTYNLKVVICLAITKLNFPMLPEIVADFLTNLHPDDIRLIPVTQEQFTLEEQKYYHQIIQPQLLQIASKEYPFLRYRINNFFDVRGLEHTEIEKCYVVLDERTVGGQYLYPCNIYIRERGQPMASVSDPDKNEKIWRWFLKHNCMGDPICRNYCCDVTREYNLMVQRCLQDLFEYPLFQPPVVLETILQETPIQQVFQQFQAERSLLPLELHLKRTALNAGYLGKKLHWHFLTVYYLMRAALLHDIGKSHAAIRHLAGQHHLPPHHKQLVRQHTVYGKEMLEQLGYQVEGKIAFQHHERIDGSGYQRIQLNWPMAELVALSDAYTALTEPRYGRSQFSSCDSVQMIRAGECGPFRGMYVTTLQQCYEHKLLC
ncbi:metal dependent phosphohydrolase [Candidatus Vecturithrix granuli]|uniref:Metal dependent phosphohydrolase n=1 Tax=Vecturithrix granuli TaxID=1499967 RepID=A0A081C6S6_VECG1|nr:metal dependent phosphohydrolase [Candidatus Vecturithrix granuli]